MSSAKHEQDESEPHELLEELVEESVDSAHTKGGFRHRFSTFIKKDRSRKLKVATWYSLGILVLLGISYFAYTLLPHNEIGNACSYLKEHMDKYLFLYMLGGFLAQLIDGALGMAYGVSVTTFLLSLGLPGITPAVASASMHASEIFTTGSSSLIYMRYKNINMKLFRKLLWPGAIGAVLGASVISLISKQYIVIVKPIIGVYTLILGVLIIVKAIKVSQRKTKKVKYIQPIAALGGFFDSVGGGGWGPIVTTSLIAGGRHLRYSIGSSHLAKFFVAIISTATFFIMIGVEHLQIIFGLIVGGMIAAPISIFISRKIPVKGGLILVGALVIIVSLRNIIQIFL